MIERAGPLLPHRQRSNPSGLPGIRFEVGFRPAAACARPFLQGLFEPLKFLAQLTILAPQPFIVLTQPAKLLPQPGELVPQAFIALPQSGKRAALRFKECLKSGAQFFLSDPQSLSYVT